MQMTPQYDKMCSVPVWQSVLKSAFPAMASMLAASVYNLADTYFVSRLGSGATGAVGIVFSLMALIQAVGFTVGMGAGSVISRTLGKKEKEEAAVVAASALLTGILSGGLITLFGYVFRIPMLRLFGASDTILPDAAAYASYILYASPVMCGSFVLNNLLRAEGHTGYGLAGILAGGFFNILLDPFLIFGLRLGIKGAAIATAAGQTAGFLVLLSFYLTKKTVLLLQWKKIARDRQVYADFLKNGVPSLFRQGLAAVSAVLLNRAACAYGDRTVAAVSVAGRIFMVVFCLVIGYGQGYQPVAGYNYGAGDPDRVRKSFWFTVLTSTGVAAAAAAVLYGFAPGLVHLFASGDNEVEQTAQTALRMQSVVLPLLPLGVVANMTFQAVGKPVTAAFLASCRQGVFFLPFLFLFRKICGVTGILVAQPAADVATFLICIPFLWSFLKKI